MVYGLLYYFVYFIYIIYTLVYICRESVNQLNDENSVFFLVHSTTDKFADIHSLYRQRTTLKEIVVGI